jgi:biotin operon repressor
VSDAGALGRALAGRLDDIAAALDRYTNFAFLPDTEAARTAFAADEKREAAHELVLRALRAAADPLNDRILRRLDDGDAPLGELAELLELPRLAVWERMSDLVQTGLAVRSLETDRAALTPAGRALVELVEEATNATASHFPTEKREMA